MSKLAEDAAAFKASLAVTNTQTWHSAQPSSSAAGASAGASGSSSNPDKKKRPKQNIVYSQPADTGVGTHRLTQLVYALDWLKGQNAPRRIEDIAAFSQAPIDTDKVLFEKFIAHERIEYDPKMNLATFKHDYDVRNKAMLLTEIQRATRRGNAISVRALKDSWKEAPAAIEELEKSGDVFVTRTLKDGQMRMVFLNELAERNEEQRREGANATGLSVEKEFLDLWHSLKVPNDVDLLKQLANEGLQATAGESSTVRAPVGKKKGKRSAPRNRQAKITNLHLKGTSIDLTKDYVPPGK